MIQQSEGVVDGVVSNLEQVENVSVVEWQTWSICVEDRTSELALI
jgi:transcription initiation factor IIF auxiliary subunit